MGKYINFLSSEFSSYLSVKLGMLVLMLLSVYTTIEAVQSYKTYQERIQVIEAQLSEEQYLTVNYSGFRNDIPLTAAPVVEKLKEELDMEAFYFSLSSELLCESEDFFLEMEEPIHFNQKNYYVPKSLHLNQAMYDYLELLIKEGKGLFSEPNSEKYIPVVLGHSYQGKYKVGEILTLIYPGDSKNSTTKDINCQVVGFLEENTRVFNHRFINFSDTNLDDYLILGQTGDVAKYADELSNYFFMDVEKKGNNLESPIEIIQKVEPIANENGYQGLLIEDDKLNNRNELSMYQYMAEETFLKATLFSLFSVLQLFLIIQLLVKKRLRTYRIFYHLGLTKKAMMTWTFISFMGLYLVGVLLLVIVQTFLLEKQWQLASFLLGAGLWQLLFMLLVGLCMGIQLKKERMVV